MYRLKQNVTMQCRLDIRRGRLEIFLKINLYQPLLHLKYTK